MLLDDKKKKKSKGFLFTFKEMFFHAFLAFFMQFDA